MAKQLNYTDSFGENYPSSYWHPVQVNLCKSEKNGLIQFVGYPDQARVGKRSIGEKRYFVNSDNYDKYFSATAIDPLNVNHLSQAYVLADATLDTNGKSFFDGATDI